MASFPELPSGCSIDDPLPRLLQFCEEEYAYYDGVPLGSEYHIEPLDVLVTASVNSFIRDAAAVRRIHRGLAAACDPVLQKIPTESDLARPEPVLTAIRELLHAAVQVRGVLIPVATKVLHRKRPQLIPMLDNVLLGHYLGTPSHAHWLPATQNAGRAADAGMVALRRFRDDLESASGPINEVCAAVESRGFRLTPVRALEILVWMQCEPRGYYRSPV